MTRKVNSKKRKTNGTKEDILRLNQELSILNAISQAVNESIDLDEILNKSLDKIMELTGVRSAGFYLLDENNGDLVYVAHRGFSKGFLKGMKRIKLGEGATGKVASSGEPRFIDDYLTYSDSMSLAIEEGVRSLVVVPLKSRDKVRGTLNIARKEFHHFTPFEKDLFTATGQIIGGAIQGLGTAVVEGYIYDERGRLLNSNFTDNKIPTARDIPAEIETFVVETPQIDGPYGVRGVAEHPMISVPSAVGNALYDALSIEFRKLPLTAERIHRAIRDSKEGR